MLLSKVRNLALLSLILFSGAIKPILGQTNNLSGTALQFEKDNEVIKLPYYASHDIEEKNDDIERLVIVVHGTNRNADDYYNNMRGAMLQRPDIKDQTLIIAPQFITEIEVDDHNLGRDYPYWSSDGWKVGSNSRNESSNPRDIRIPSYEVLDSLIMRVVSNFSNLQTFIFTGHSAGGQLTNRYTASSPIFELLCQEHNISSKSIIANPGSYVYMTDRRRVEGSMDQFEVPTGCSEYNEYSYGLEDLYTYHSRSGASQLKEWYGSREVIYLLGESDNNPNASTLPSSCRAQLQGDHRLERGLIYYNHILETFGAEISTHHRLELVPNVGHDNFDMYHSSQGLRELFDSAPFFSCSDQTTATSDLHSIDVIIYPNPAQKSLHFKGLQGNEALRITDISGRTILEKENISSSIDISMLHAGLYRAQFISNNTSILLPFVKL